MSDTTFFQSTAGHTANATAAGKQLLKLAIAGRAVLREWWHNYCSRRELSLLSHYDRNDLSFSAEADAEIAKPFWKR